MSITKMRAATASGYGVCQGVGTPVTVDPMATERTGETDGTVHDEAVGDDAPDDVAPDDVASDDVELTEDAGKGEGTPSTDDAAPATTAKARPTAKAKPVPPAAKRKAAVAKKKDDAGASKRYTAPVPSARRRPSPRWVPMLMFGLWGVGLLLIILNYMGVLPGSADGGNGWYLVAGLGSILVGIITATQYH